MTTHLYPPGPTGKPIIGSFFDFYHDMPGFLYRVAGDYGDIVHFKLGHKNAFLLNHPDFIKDTLLTHHNIFTKGRASQRSKLVFGNGLLTSQGNFHLSQRRLIQPAFHHKEILNHDKAMVDCASRVSERWQEGTTLDIHTEMMRLTISIASRTLFDADIESDIEETIEAVNEIAIQFPRAILPFSELLDRLPLRSNRRFETARRKIDSVISRMIEKRRTEKKDKPDFLSILLHNMTDRQVRDEAVTFFLAGYESTALALTWTWYLLSQYPDVKKKLHKELDTGLGSRLPSAEDLNRLSYAKTILLEAIRLYPPVWTLAPISREDYEVGGYVIPKGSFVFMSQYVMHRNPRYYPDPLNFVPERWDPEIHSSRPRFSYFPFGVGPRLCIGESFALMEGVLIIATLAKKWKFTLVPGHPVEIQPFFTLRPKYGMQMTLERR